MSDTGRIVPVLPGRVQGMTLQEASAALFGERSGESPATVPAERNGPPRMPQASRSDASGTRDDDEEADRGTSEHTPEPEPPEPPPEPEQPEPPPAAAEATDDPEFELRVGDKTESVKLSELQNGYLRQADYTRKTMEAAQYRRDYETALNGLQEERKTYSTLLKELRRTVETGMTSPEEMERLRQLDPVGYLLADKQQQQKRDYLAAITQEEQVVAQRQQQEHQRWLQQARADSSAVIMKQIPAWQQEEVRRREIDELARIGTEIYGYTMQELSQIIDPRFVIMARDAMLYRQGQGRTNGVQAKRLTPQPGRPVPAKRSVPMSDPNAARREATQQRFNRSPSINSAVEAILAERGE